MLIDMHIHTSYSPCSVIDLPQLLQRVQKAGLDGICITDHDTIAAKRVLRNNPGLGVIVGIEYTTAHGDFLVFGPIDYIPGQMNAKHLLRWVQREGGVAIAAHPFRKYRPVEPCFLYESKIIESVNGRNLPNENELCKKWLRQYGNGVKEIGGSDAHTIEEIGQVVTVFKNNVYDVDDLIRELKGVDYIPLRRHALKITKKTVVQDIIVGNAS